MYPFIRLHYSDQLLVDIPISNNNQGNGSDIH